MAIDLLYLPLELRELVYVEYLTAHPACDSDLSPPILRVSKQISEEAKVVFQRRGEYVYRIAWNCEGYLGLSLASLKEGARDADYSSFKHLIIEIIPLPPLVDVEKVIALFRRILRLYSKLRAVHHLQHLTVRFLENELMSWDNSGEDGTLSMGNFSNYFDIKHCLKLFATLRNVTTTDIELPTSVQDDEELEELARGFKQSMEGIEPADPVYVNAWLERLGLGIEHENSGL